MFWVFVALTLILLLEAVLTLRTVLNFREFFLREVSRGSPGSVSWPRVALLAPCKGIEPGLQENIASWFRLEYPDFKIFFIVESPDDPAVSVIRQFPASELLVAGKSETCGQKVHNLRYAISVIPAEFEAFAFIDSDCFVKPDWLRNLIRTVLQEPHNAASGYRWFTNDTNFVSLLRAAWNSSVLSLYQEKGKHNFAWGGSTAILRETFEAARVPDFWNGSISDDYSLTNALQSSGRRVNFVPGALAFTRDSIGLVDFLKWAFRQLLITRIYYRRLWAAAFLFHCVWMSWIATGLFFPGYFSAAFVLIQWIQAFKADLRWQCANRYGVSSKIQRYCFWFFGPLIGLCNSLLILSTIFTRTIHWRGVRYVLFGPNRVQVHHR